jgi:signal transduction histidine kinase
MGNAGIVGHMVGGAILGNLRGLWSAPSRQELRSSATSLRRFGLLVALLGAVAVAVGALVGSSLVDASVTDQGLNLCRAAASALFLAAGVLRVARWRMAGDPRSGLMGIALLVLGGLTLPLSTMVREVTADNPDSVLAPLVRALMTAIVLVIVAQALRHRGSASSGIGRTITSAWTARSLGLFWCLLLLESIVGSSGGWTSLSYGLLISTVGAAWCVLGLLAALQRHTEDWAARTAPLLVSMGVAELLRLPSSLGAAWATVAAAMLTASVAALTVYSSLRDLVEATNTQHNDLADLSQALGEARQVASVQNAWRQELSHDAHNALAGLRAALLTLERYGGAMDAAAVDHLRAAAIEEVSHLEHLIVRRGKDLPVDFEVSEVIRNVVATRRATGLDVRLGSTQGRAHGRPGDLATVLQNLLVNAQRHASGSSVEVSAVHVIGAVEIRVVDKGPGIRDDEVSSVFERGAHGRQSQGTGLGLFVARELMREQDGELRLARYAGGCEFVAVLQEAQAALQATLPAQRQAGALHLMPTAEAL